MTVLGELKPPASKDWPHIHFVDATELHKHPARCLAWARQPDPFLRVDDMHGYAASVWLSAERPDPVGNVHPVSATWVHRHTGEALALARSVPVVVGRELWLTAEVPASIVSLAATFAAPGTVADALPPEATGGAATSPPPARRP